MFVVTADQRGSTEKGDRVESLMTELAPWAERWADEIALPLERTVGDEVQIMLTHADPAVDLALHLMRLGEWSVGVGAGPVNEPWGASARASSGAAFVHARQAVERARGRSESVPVVVSGEDDEAGEGATAILQLLAAVVRRRSAAGWEVADLLGPEATQRDIAARLGISEQAVSQRVTSAMLDEERRARPVAATLLARAATTGDE
ncbi:winged helix-turn-helix domain-containing protein [Demequina sp. SO4-13]|uniref:winged helix-turn-helix domain-containing protein n=1 Tax=Demequina sp. SO4-13 TaxID=3401027 RepID=UPI003AF5E0AE